MSPDLLTLAGGAIFRTHVTGLLGCRLFQASFALDMVPRQDGRAVTGHRSNAGREPNRAKAQSSYVATRSSRGPGQARLRSVRLLSRGLRRKTKTEALVRKRTEAPLCDGRAQSTAELRRA